MRGSAADAGAAKSKINNKPTNRFARIAVISFLRGTVTVPSLGARNENSEETMMSTHLFTRRQFLAASATIAAATSLRAEETPPVKFGEGSASFTLDPAW